MIYLLNKSHIPNNPLREDILEAANDYIGEVYAYDRGSDYLAIDRYNLKVCLTNKKFPEVPYHDWAYYSAISIVKPVANSLQLEPDQLAIDAITLDFFPIERLENFRKTAKESIIEFVKERGIIQKQLVVLKGDEVYYLNNNFDWRDDGTLEKLGDSILCSIRFLNSQSKE